MLAGALLPSLRFLQGSPCTRGSDSWLKRSCTVQFAMVVEPTASPRSGFSVFGPGEETEIPDALPRTVFDELWRMSTEQEKRVAGDCIDGVWVFSWMPCWSYRQCMLLTVVNLPY